MIKAVVKLNNVDNVKKLVNTVNKTDFNVDLVSGRYIIDAKSIMGVYSLDLSKPVEMRIHSDDKETVNSLLKDLGSIVS